jgi:hypothetical protein
VYVLYADKDEYIDGYDIKSGEFGTISDKYNAEHFDMASEASLVAGKLGVSYTEINIED